jgi:hypothetical protein
MGILVSVLTLSRHSLLAMLIASPFFLFSRNLVKRKTSDKLYIYKKIAISIVIFAIAIPIFLTTSAGGNLIDRLNKGGVGEDYNLQARLIDGPQRVTNLINSDPNVLLYGLGTGARNIKFGENAQELRKFVQEGMISNSFVIPLVYLGFFGFLCFLAFWLWDLRVALILKKSLSWNAVGIVIGMFVIVASDNYSYNQKSAIAMWSLLSGILSGLYYKQKSKLKFFR